MQLRKLLKSDNIGYVRVLDLEEWHFQWLVLKEAYFEFLYFTAVPEGPGRFPEGIPEGKMQAMILLASRKVPEGFRKSFRKVTASAI